MITRFAPTPSGYLHLGNAVNLRLASWLATQQDGQLALRIDDMDLTRARSEYVDDIFDVLAWLGIEWTHGPRDHADFDRHHRLSLRTDRYRRELTTALAGGLDAYACACSGLEWRASRPAGARRGAVSSVSIWSLAAPPFARMSGRGPRSRSTAR